MLDGDFTVHKAMQTSEMLSRLAAAMLPDAAARHGASSRISCILRTVAVALMAVADISAANIAAASGIGMVSSLNRSWSRNHFRRIDIGEQRQFLV